MLTLDHPDEKLDAVPTEHLPVYCLEAEILKLPQVEMPIEHEFCSNLYARTMHIPAGTVATGAVHREECFFVVRKGTLVVATENGPLTLEAGAMVITKVGTKRAVVALTDVTVTTFHPNPENETDPMRLWDMFTVSAPPSISYVNETKKMEGLS